MKHIISYKTMRYLNIIEHAMSHDSISIASIQALNQCSKTTVYDDLDVIASRWGTLLHVDMTKNQFQIRNHGMLDFIHIKNELFEDEVALKLLLYVFNHPNTSMYRITEDLSYSESYLRRQMSKINQYLKAFECEIRYDTQTKTYALHSEQELIMHYVICEVMKLSNNTAMLMTLTASEQRHLEAVIDNHPLALTSHTINDLTMLYKVAVIRIRQNQYLPSDFKKDFDDAMGALQASVAVSKGRMLIRESMIEFFELNEIELAVEQFEKLLDIYTSIIIKSSFYPHKVDIYKNRYDIFYRKFKIKNPYFIHEFEQSITRLTDHIHVSLEEYASEIMFLLYTNIDTLRKYRSFSIGIYSDLGEEHAHSLKLVLQKHFPQQNLQIYQSNKHYDIILTTSQHVFLNHEAEIVTISDLIGELDFSTIYQTIYTKMDYIKVKKT